MLLPLYLKMEIHASKLSQEGPYCRRKKIKISKCYPIAQNGNNDSNNSPSMLLYTQRENGSRGTKGGYSASGSAC